MNSVEINLYIGYGEVPQAVVSTCGTCSGLSVKPTEVVIPIEEVNATSSVWKICTE